MKKKTLLGILVCLFFSVAQAQIGYQVALLNSATGEPRANETVKAEVTITDSQNDVVCSETQTVTSNDFGILSFTVGNADTFKDVAIGKLPMSIAVTVDDVLIGKSQILNVPVAEVANTLKSDFTLDELCGKKLDFGTKGYATWKHVLFNTDGTGIWYTKEGDTEESIPIKYGIEGNVIYIYYDDNYEGYTDYGGRHTNELRWIKGKLYRIK